MKFPLNNGKHGGLWKRAWFNIFCGIFSHHQSQYPLEMKYRQGWCSIRTCINACKSNYDWERMGMISKPKKQLSPTIIDVNSCHWSIRKSCCLWLITIFINSSCLGVTKSPWWMSLLCPFWNWCGMGHAPKNQFWIQTLYVNQIAMFGVPRFFTFPDITFFICHVGIFLWHNLRHFRPKTQPPDLRYNHGPPRLASPANSVWAMRDGLRCRPRSAPGTGSWDHRGAPQRNQTSWGFSKCAAWVSDVTGQCIQMMSLGIVFF
jgi:hypothetical protein